MNTRRGKILIAVAGLSATPGMASGFAFYEQGAKASAEGGAWIARADDASANWYNPAALVHGAKGEVQFGFNYLETGSDTHFSPAPGVSFDAVSNVSTPLHFYFGQKINDRLAFGVGFNNPFGLVSEWKNAPLTLSSRRAELRTYLLNPNFAFKISERWSAAIGVDYLAAEVTDFARDAAVGPFTTTANLRGEGDAFGYNVALQFKMDCFSIAGQYRSPLTVDIRGNLTFTGVPAFLNSPAHTDVDLPAQSMVGAAWTSRWVDVELAGYYTEWNRFKNLIIDTGNPATSATLIQNWTGTWSYRLGLAFRLDHDGKHELRAGGVVDDSPIPTQYLRPSIPDSDRTGYSLGYGYLAKTWGVDIYAMYLKFDDVTANGLPTDGVIPGTYSTTIPLAGVTFKYRY